MKGFIRHIRIAFAHLFYGIAEYIDAQDAEDIRAKMRRLDPSFEKSGEPIKEEK